MNAVQLELGVVPLKCGLKEGVKVAFKLTKNKRKGSKERVTEIRYGRVVSISDRCVVIEDISAPGSRHNRSADDVFEVYKEMTLRVFE